MSSSERIRRALPLSARLVRVGECENGTVLTLDSRPQSVQEAEDRYARQTAALRLQHQSELEEAYRNGYNDGAAMARADAADERERMCACLDGLLDECARTRADWFTTYEQQMVELVTGALEQILGDRPPVAERVLHALRRAIQGLTEGDKITVRCNPGDLRFIQEASGRSPEEWVGTRQVRLVGDGEVRPNGCLVETTLGVVDARVEQQLALLRGALFDALPSAIEAVDAAAEMSNGHQRAAASAVFASAVSA